MLELASTITKKNVIYLTFTIRIFIKFENQNSDSNLLEFFFKYQCFVVKTTEQEYLFHFQSNMKI